MSNRRAYITDQELVNTRVPLDWLMRQATRRLGRQTGAEHVRSGWVQWDYSPVARNYQGRLFFDPWHWTGRRQ